ncbi:hypothetical protein ACFVUW_10450 [Streptomyces xiamenensis]|uniref:hypothetical protein n=1 Tax=Streptomyces xiamenensis TaxID=408015 RepID=UPI0036EED473
MATMTRSGNAFDTLLREVNEVLERHGASGFRLIYGGGELPSAGEQILVQTTDPHTGAIILHPRKAADLTPHDLIHSSQVIDPADAISLTTEKTDTEYFEKRLNGELKHFYR